MKNIFSEATEKLYTNKVNKVFFVLSTGRCGTRYMANLLNLAGNATVLHEPEPGCESINPIACNFFFSDIQRFNLMRVHDFDLLYRHASIYKQIDTEVFGDCYNSIYPFAIPLYSFFKEKGIQAKFIHLIRNPLECCMSILRSEGPNGIGIRKDFGLRAKQLITATDPAVNAVNVWVKINQIISYTLQKIENMAPNSTCMIKIEDMNDYDRVTKLYQFLDLNIPDRADIQRIMTDESDTVKHSHQKRLDNQNVPKIKDHEFNTIVKMISTYAKKEPFCYDIQTRGHDMSASFKKSLKHNPRILLIQAAYPSSPFPAHIPIGLGYLARQLELHHIPYDVFDLNLNSKDNLFDKIKRLKPEYIGFSLMSLDLPVNYKTIKEIKAAVSEIKIIAGGPHISFMGEKALEECEAIDFGIVHEGEQTLVDLLNNMAPDTIDGLIYRKENGIVHRNKNRAFAADMDAFLFPTFEKFELNKYDNVIQIASSRGCPYPCTFCGAHLSMGKTWRARSAKNVFNEIAFWYEKGYQHFNFVDSNFFVSKKRVTTLCALLEKKHMNISLSFDGMRLKDANPEILHLLKKFGLKHIAVGIESANNDTLAFIQKGETLEDMKKGMDILKHMDISVDAFFILGLPGDTIGHIFNSFAFALNYPNIKKVYFFNVNPLPNTQLFKFAQENNLLAGNKNQIYQNIGGMGNDILMLSNDLSLEQQKILLQYSKIISRSVELNHLLYESEKKPMPHLDVQAVQAETKRLETFSNYYLNILKNYSKPSEKLFPDMDHADKIFTHLTIEEKYKLYELALHSSGKVFVEIGSYLGASSCYIARAIQSDPSKKLYCVDTWENDAMTEGAKDTFDEFCINTSSYSDSIVALRGKSIEVARTFGLGIDYLFLDADHSYEAVKADILAWLPKLNQNATVICHDTGWAEGVKKALNEMITPISIHHDALPNMYWTKIRSDKKIKKINTSSIHLSVIIPTRNRAKRLSKALESLTIQTYPEDLFEVIVVDNGSSGETRDVCRKYENLIKNFQFVYESEPGLHTGRHAGWRKSKGDILVYADDDIRASSTWLEGIAQCFKDPDVALAGGNILPDFENDPPEWVEKLWHKTPWGKVLGPYSLIDFGTHDSEISPMYVWGANFAIKKTVLSEAGGFHPDGMPSKLSRFRGDGETFVSEFIQRHKHKTVHHSRATVFHWISKERMTVEYLYKRMFLQGISDSFTYIRSNKAVGELKQYKSRPDGIEDALFKGHCNGYNYHHIEVKKDPELLKWILQGTYVPDNLTQEDRTCEKDIKQVHDVKKHIQAKDYYAALQILDKISHISPNIKNLQYLRTICLLNLGRNGEANEAALSELKIFPENSDCKNLMNLFSSNDGKNICNANKMNQGAV